MFAQQNLLQQQQLPIQQHQQVAPVQEDFYLLDLVGGASHTCFHPTRPIVAYTSGCMIIVYDMMTDQKINLVHHQHEVFALAFSPPGAGASQVGGDFLVSVDFDRNDVNDPNSSSSSIMCLWNWQRGERLQEIQIPKSQNHNGSYVYQPPSGQQLPRNIQIVFEKVGSHFFVLESGSLSGSLDSGSGYRATMWNLNRQQRIEMINQLELELQNGCLGLQIIPKQSYSTSAQSHHGLSSNNSVPGSQYSSQQQIVNVNSQRLRFLTLERQAIKIWEYQQGHADLIKRIQIKQNMKQCVVAELTGYLLILGDNGKVLILDQEGEFISTVKRDMTYFTTISTAHDKLLLGTDRGTICVYHLASLQFINEVPYQLGVLSNFMLNQSALVDKRLTQQQEDPSVYQLGPPVLQIGTTQNMRFLFIKYQDQSFVMLDRTVAQPSQAVLGYQYGHFQKVTGLQWMPNTSDKFNKKSYLLSGDNFFGSTNTGVQNNSQQNQSSFITCAQDMSIFVWRHFGDRWSFSYIDVVKGCFDQSLTYQRKLNEKSTQNLELTSIKIYPKSPMVIVGDNKGIVRIFQITTERALFMASHQLQKGSDQTISIEDPIKELYITQDELYSIVSFKSGLICCYDVRNSFALIGIIEKDAQRFCYSNQLEVRMKIIETDTSSLNHFNTLRLQDEKPLYSITTFDHDLLNPTNTSFSTTFRILSTTSPNCIQLQSVQIKGHKLSKTPISQFIIDEGKITGFDVHPSNNYLLVTSNQGRIYLYRIDTGELRGTIKIPLNAIECVLDPSGLYVLVQVPPFNLKHTANLIPGLNEVNNNLSQNERDLERTTLLMFEVGTGRTCAELKSLFEVSTMSFSPDGRYLSLGSRNGAVCVWALGEHLLGNIKQVLEASRMSPDFWANYPIFLEDYGIYGMAQTIPAQIFTSHDLRQLDRPEDYQQQHQLTPQQDRYDVLTDGLLDSQGIDYSNQKSTQRYNQQPIFQNQDAKHQQPIQPQNKALIRPPATQQQKLIDKQIQNTLPTNPSNRKRSLERQPQYQLQQQQQQNKFLRKTFVEDQQTQVTPQVSGYLNHQKHLKQSKKQISQVPQHNNASQRTAQIQTSEHLPNSMPDYQQNYQPQPVQHQNLQNRISPQRQYNSQSSLISSPNRAELLYRDDLPMTQLHPTQHLNDQHMAAPPHSNLMNNFQDRQYPNQLLPHLGTSQQQQQPQLNNQGLTANQVNFNGGGTHQFIPRQDFIDRTINNNNQNSGSENKALGYLNQHTQPRNIFQEAEEQFSKHPPQNYNSNNFMGSIGKNTLNRHDPITYEENLDAADLYNPFTLNQDQRTKQMQQPLRNTNLYATGQTIPIASINQSPIKQQQVNTINTNPTSNLALVGSTAINYGGGRLIQPQPHHLESNTAIGGSKKGGEQVKDPIDIDDDVSDHGPECLENQLKELDGMNKYMHNIRVPTRFANDDFLAVHGREGGEKAYTLGRLRAEERLISLDPATAADNILEENSNGGASTYDLVEEMYENMNSFDQKLKNQHRINHMGIY